MFAHTNRTELWESSLDMIVQDQTSKTRKSFVTGPVKTLSEPPCLQQQPLIWNNGCPQWASPSNQSCAAEQQGLLLVCTDDIWLWVAALSVCLSGVLYQSSQYYSRSQIGKPPVPRQIDKHGIALHDVLQDWAVIHSQANTNQGIMHGPATCWSGVLHLGIHMRQGLGVHML